MKTADIYLQPGHLIRRAHQMATAVFAEANNAFDITPVQFSALIVVRECPGIDATRVSELIFFDRATIGNVLERLESKGLIVRKSGVKDRRTKQIFLTPKGQAIIKKIEATTASVAQRILAPLAVSDRARFLRMLAQLTDLNGRDSAAVESDAVGAMCRGRVDQ